MAGNYTSRRGLRPACRSGHPSVTTAPVGGTVPAVPALRGWERVRGRWLRRGHATPKPSKGLCRTGSGCTSGSPTGLAGTVTCQGAHHRQVDLDSREAGGMGRGCQPHREARRGAAGRNLPISNNCQQTIFSAVGRWVDTFGRCVRSRASSLAPRGVVENTKFLDNDFITASR